MRAPPMCLYCRLLFSTRLFTVLAARVPRRSTPGQNTFPRRTCMDYRVRPLKRAGTSHHGVPLPHLPSPTTTDRRPLVVAFTSCVDGWTHTHHGDATGYGVPRPTVSSITFGIYLCPSLPPPTKCGFTSRLRNA